MGAYLPFSTDNEGDVNVSYCGLVPTCITYAVNKLLNALPSPEDSPYLGKVCVPEGLKEGRKLAKEGPVLRASSIMHATNAKSKEGSDQASHFAASPGPLPTRAQHWTDCI